MEKGYLESMTFGLCRDKAQTDLVEQFQYKFAYESDVVTMADSFGTDVAIPLSQSSQVKQLFLCTIMTDLRQVCIAAEALLGLHSALWCETTCAGSTKEFLLLREHAHLMRVCLPSQADMKTVKYQIVRMMRMLIQVPVQTSP